MPDKALKKLFECDCVVQGSGNLGEMRDQVHILGLEGVGLSGDAQLDLWENITEPFFAVAPAQVEPSVFP